MSKIEISVVIPTFNEEENILPLLQKTVEVLRKNGLKGEIIVVDDGSRDATRVKVRKARETNRNIILIERDNERGLSSAMIRGYDEARGEYLGSMDADLAHDPVYLPEMLRIIEAGEAEFVIGSRYVKGAEFKGKPFLNRLASVIGQWLIRLVLGLRVKDTSNNYRLFRRALWPRIRKGLHSDGNIMLTEIVYRAGQTGASIKEIPIRYLERRAGKSKLSVLKETKKFLKNILKIRFAKL